MGVTYKKIKKLHDFIDCIRLRVDVFIKEQGFQPGWEPDELDKEAIQFAAVKEGVIVAAARARKTADGEFRIERMVVSKESRGKGIGSGLLKFIIKDLKKRNPKRMLAINKVENH